MLVLTRKIGESIQIGHNVVVTVSKVTGGHAAACAIRLAIDAPRAVDIVRTELLQDSEEHSRRKSRDAPASKPRPHSSKPRG
jgi:carbon storage regulator